MFSQINKVVQMDKNNKLAHLSHEQLDDLIKRYQDKNNKVADLIDEFRIDARPSELLSLFPLIRHEQFCQYCKNTNLVSRVKARSPYGSNVTYCPECGHKSNENCQCDNCIWEVEKVYLAKQKHKRSIIIDSIIKQKIEMPDLDQISLSDALFILALSRHTITEDLQHVAPFNDSDIGFAPTFQFTHDIFESLHLRGFLEVSPISPVDAFIFDEDETCIDGYYPGKVWWNFLPAMNANSKLDFIRELESRVSTDEWPEPWRIDMPELWHQIAKYECIENFLHLLEQRNFRLDKIGNKTHSVFETLLSDFSVSRIFSLSWMAVRDTSDYLARERIPPWKGKNNFIGAIQLKAERAKAQGWEVRHARRNYNLPQTVVSATFFNYFLKIGDKAFEMVPPAIE